VFNCPSCLLLALLSLSTLVKVFDDDSDEHVEHEEADEQQERDEVEKAPFVVVDLRLQRHATIDVHISTPSTGRRGNVFIYLPMFVCF